MKNDEMTRKEFLVLTFTLIGGTAVAASSCGSDSPSPADGGGTGGNSGGGTGGNSGGGCTDPVTAPQSADSHTHVLTITAAQINAGAPTMFTVSTVGGHAHTVTLTTANFASLVAGQTVTLTSSTDGAPAHSHTYTVSCA